MAYFSHSKISTFEQCKFKYWLQYVEKVKVEIPTTIEAFMGSLVHEALEKLYHDLIKYSRLNSSKDLLYFYLTQWQKKFDDKILIVRKNMTAEDYKTQGTLLLLNYYKNHKPFNQFKTLAVETQDKIKLGSDYYHIRIDRLDTDKRGNYYVCDYKTSSTMKTPEQIRNDRQLFMYSLWIKENFSDVNSINLLWYMLKFNKDLLVKVDDSKAEEVKQRVIESIKEIKRTKDFPANVSPLCKWCVYKDICPYYNKNISMDKFNAFLKKAKNKVIKPSKAFIGKDGNEEVKIDLNKVNLNTVTTVQNKLNDFF